VRSLVHFCPFCDGRLEIWHHDFHTIYACCNEGCVNDDMPRYQATYNNYPTVLTGYIFMLDKYYVQISYANQITVISRLEACMLFDTMQLPRALSIDFEDLDTFLNKIKTILTFS
jgi:hypothetical protein